MSAIGVLVENCVTDCVMESMCGTFQLSDLRTDPYLWPQSFEAPTAAPVPCVGRGRGVVIRNVRGGNMVKGSTCEQSSVPAKSEIHPS